MTHTITPDDQITVTIPDHPDINLNVSTIHDAIQLATMISFDSWMDQTNASGKWPVEITNHQAETDYQMLNNDAIPLSLRFDTAVRVLFNRNILISLA